MPLYRGKGARFQIQAAFSGVFPPPGHQGGGPSLPSWPPTELKGKETMAVGDSYNDLEMLDYAGLGVVVANARRKSSKGRTTRNGKPPMEIAWWKPWKSLCWEVQTRSGRPA